MASEAPTTSPPEQVSDHPLDATPLGRWLLRGLPVLAVLVLIAAGLASHQRPANELPIIARVPDFTLTHHDGSTVGLERFLGTPWIADFIFTRCPAICPRMTAQMKQVTERLGDDSPVRIASFSVDPEHDTPEVLARYAESHDAGSDWYFLTGDKQAIYNLSRDGFMLGIDDEPPPGELADSGPILHSNRFVLVDAQGRIRSYYDPFDTAEIERLHVDVRELLESR